MRVRVNFERGAGVCLWADDAAARARWCSAVSFAHVALAEALAAEGEALIAEFDAAFDPAGNAGGPRWSDGEHAGFQARATEWTARVRESLRAAGIAVAPYGAQALPDAAGGDGAAFEGCVVACFQDEESRAAADRAEGAGTGWVDAALWNGDVLQLRHAERTPAALLAKLERCPGFVCGWWQAREDRGEEEMLEGDPVAHAVACVRERNATGLANLLSWMRVERVHLGEELAAQAWAPAKRHRLADPGGTWWEWFSFVRQAAKAVRGQAPSARYRRAERERLIWKWTHGGSRDGWPATWGEACARIGLQRESFNRWAK